MDILSILVVGLVTFAAIIAGTYAYGMSHLREIKENWIQYRCNPVYMPLAGAVGSDIFTNFTNCTLQSVQSYAGFVMDPIYQNFQMLMGIFTGILDSMQAIRKKMNGTVDAFLGIVSSTFGKIQNTIATILLLVGRIRTIMNRVISIFVVMLHLATTGIKSGMSITNGPIGKTAEFLCFDPDTIIKTWDGKRIRILEAELGTKLENGAIVRSVMIFDGLSTPMVDIDGVRVSANHKVLYNNHWIPCGEHPSAIEIFKSTSLVCLNTDTHTIPVRNMIFKDYEETDDVDEFYRDVSTYYNAPDVPPLRKLYRETGFHPHTTRIRMEDMSIKNIEEIHIGDRLHIGGRVIGKIVHLLPVPFAIASVGVHVAPGTIILCDKHLITAADSRYDSTSHPEKKERWVVQFLTENARVVLVDDMGGDIVCLDDQEVPSTDIHEKRDKKVLGL